MPSALTRRLEERSRIAAAHLSRPDLVRFQDDRLQFDFDKSQQLVVKAKLIAGNVVKLAALSGIGDACWSRAVVRETLKAGMEVLLDTPHPWAFWDFEGVKGFRLYRGEEGIYTRGATYLGQDLHGQGLSVFAAMCKRCHVPLGDFSLPIHPSWDEDALRLLERINPSKPVMVYRPLLRNHGRRSVESRNPDPQAYSTIFSAIRDRFHVVSVATHGAGEDIIHADHADSVFHHGEIPVTTLMALMKRAALVYTNAGMALVAASALGVPVIVVMGGYEGSLNYRDTAGVYGPALLIDPVKPCYCLSDSHPCDKSIDLPAAVKSANAFIGAHC